MRKQEQAALAIKVEDMEKYKLTINKHRFIPVNQKLQSSRFIKFYRNIKCFIKQSVVE